MLGVIQAYRKKYIDKLTSDTILRIELNISEQKNVKFGIDDEKESESEEDESDCEIKMKRELFSLERGLIFNNRDLSLNYNTHTQKITEKVDIDTYMKENRRIMIVDDEPYNILGLKIILN